MKTQPVSTGPVLRLRYLLLMAVLTAIVTAALYLRANLDRQVMAFEHVSIEAEFAHLSTDSVEQVVRANLDGDYFTLDLQQMRTALLALPWVQEVSVRRRWPSGLVITIEEKTAVAYWGDAQLLSDRGEVFSPAELAQDMSLPLLQGPEGLHANVWQRYLDVNAALDSFDTAIVALVLDDRRSWQMTLENSVSVKLGRNHIDSRLQRLYRVFAMQDSIGMATIVEIDMRYPNGFAAMHKTTDNNNNSMEGKQGARVSEV